MLHGTLALAACVAVGCAAATPPRPGPRNVDVCARTRDGLFVVRGLDRKRLHRRLALAVMVLMDADQTAALTLGDSRTRWKRTRSACLARIVHDERRRWAVARALGVLSVVPSSITYFSAIHPARAAKIVHSADQAWSRRSSCEKEPATSRRNPCRFRKERGAKSSDRRSRSHARGSHFSRAASAFPTMVL